MTNLPRRLGLVALAAFFCLTLFAPSASAQANRTWVSGIGDDSNPCARTAACKTYAGAISKTAAGGVIQSIDAGGFGAVTIAKSITIDGSGYPSGVAVNPGNNGIIVNAGVGDDVVLRGLTITGPRSNAACPFTGLTGVYILQARSVSIENTTINGLATGVRIAPGAARAGVTIDGSNIRNTCAAAVDASPTGTGSADVIIRNSVLAGARGSGNGTDGAGLRAGPNARAFVIGSTIFDNVVALMLPGGSADVYTNSWIAGNASPGDAPNPVGPTTGPIGPTGATGATGAPGTPGAQGPAGATGPASYRLVVVLPDSTLTARSGSRVTLGYVSTAPAKSVLRVKKGDRTLVTVRRNAKIGRNTIRWIGKVRGDGVAAGNYNLELEVTTEDGQKTTETAKLAVGRPK